MFTGIALVVAGLAFKASVAPFHQWTPDVYEGAPTAVTAFMAVATKAAAFGVLLRLFDVGADQLRDHVGAGAVGAGGHHDRRRERGRDRPVFFEAAARVLVGRAGGLHAGRRDGLHPPRGRGDGVLPVRVRADEPRRVRGDRGARAGDRAGRRHLEPVRAGRRPAAAGVADDDRDAGAGGHAGDGRVLRQAAADPGRGGQRVRLDRRRDRDRLGDLAGVLPARDRGGVDARRRPRRWRCGPAGARRSPAAPRRPTPRSRLRRRRGRGGRWRSCSWRSCARRPRSSSASTPSRCSTSPATPAPR